ncbi:MAG TPA: DNA replication and repair protein RecF, partial [Bryobacterales bacterium]|nr:DNA replication and repair protein RecF [Bryobacterales bacterium]
MSQGEAPITSVAVRQLTVTNFRNHAAARVEAEASLVVLTGPNGAGKTNLLEALSMLAPGRGLRRAQLADMVRVTPEGGRAPGWAVAAEIDGLQGPVRIGIAWQDAEREGGGRRVLVDGKAARSSAELGRHVRLGWLTPAMDRLFGGPASDRRRFLD